MTSSYKRWVREEQNVISGWEANGEFSTRAPSEIHFEWLNFRQADNVLFGDRESSITDFRGFSLLAV